jgi:hypothetical protein
MGGHARDNPEPRMSVRLAAAATALGGLSSSSMRTAPSCSDGVNFRITLFVASRLVRS